MVAGERNEHALGQSTVDVYSPLCEAAGLGCGANEPTRDDAGVDELEFLGAHGQAAGSVRSPNCAMFDWR